MVNNKKDINYYINDVINHVATLIDMALSEQRGLYSIACNHFGENNVSFNTFNHLPTNVLLALNSLEYEHCDKSDIIEWCTIQRINRVVIPIKSGVTDTFVYRLINNIIDESQIEGKLLETDNKVIEYNMLSSDEAIELFKNDLTLLFVNYYPDNAFINNDNSNDDNYTYALSQIVIYFDKKTIKNEHNQEHNIYDTYFILNLLPKNVVNSVGLIRSSLTKEEINTYYYHSHVHVKNIGEIGICCFGNSDLNTTYKKLNLNRNKYGDEAYFKMFLMQLEIFLEVESLNGGPYQSLQKLLPSTRIITSSEDININNKLPSILQEFIVYIAKNTSNIKLPFISKLNIHQGTIIDIGMSFTQKVYFLTNLFIDFCKYKKFEQYIWEDFFVKGQVFSDNVKLFSDSAYDYDNNCLDYDGMTLYDLTFKGYNPYISVIKSDNSIEEYPSILNPIYIDRVFKILLRYINLNFNK